MGSALVVAAHPDDEVLGCGGTMARFARDGRDVHVLLLADGETARTDNTSSPTAVAQVAARKVAAERAGKTLGCASVDVLTLPDNRLDGIELLDIVKPIEALVARFRPSIVLTHHSHDVNVDHNVVHEAVLAACRPQPGRSVEQLLFFEVASSTEWRPAGSAESFHPNWFVDIAATLTLKLEALSVYEAELRPFPHPRSCEAVEALARWRGASAGLRAAEAFVLGRNIIRTPW